MVNGRTPFRPQTDAFAFDNAWPIDGDELEEIRSYLANERDSLVRALAANRLARLLVREASAHHVVQTLLNDENVTRYGLCGGMAFAALDYFRQQWVVPQGAGPHDHPTRDGGAGSALRTYIWQRLLDSMQCRAARTMCLWSLALHLVPGGATWLLQRTRQEWTTLKRHLDAGRPWPIGLVGHANGSFANHQVLALGYDDPGDGTSTIYVYDSCCPLSTHTIALDLRGHSLVANESCAQGGSDTRWSGFFCNAYTPARPPVAVGLTADVAVAPASADGRMTVRFTARNVSYSRCPPLALRLGFTPGGADLGGGLGGETIPRPLDAGKSRTLVRTIARDRIGDENQLTGRCFLGSVEGVDVWKRLPVHGQTR